MVGKLRCCLSEKVGLGVGACHGAVGVVDECQPFLKLTTVLKCFKGIVLFGYHWFIQSCNYGVATVKL